MFNILLCIAMLLMTGTLLYGCVRDHGRSQQTRWYVLLYLCLLIWQGLELSYFCIRSPVALQVVYDLKLGVVAFVDVIVFFAVVDFYRIGRYFPAWLPAVLCIIPGITALFAVTTLNQSWLIVSFEVLSYEPVTTVHAVRGGWYYVHTVYSMAVMGAIAVIVAVRYQSLPRAYRGGTGPLALAVLGLMLGFVLEITRPTKYMVDYILVTATLGGLLFYMAIVRKGRSDYLQIERKEIFNYLDPAVFLLTTEGRVLDMNRHARAWLEIVGENVEGEDFDAFVAGLYGGEKILRKAADEGELPAGDVYFANARYPLIYRMHRQDIPGPGGRASGAFVTLEDVTRNRLFIERLQSTAGVDALTGLRNRYGYMTLLRQLDVAENLPLCVIMGDVNGLKRVNDTYGHAEGDRFLVAVARAIDGCCGENAHAARVGGDEFVILATGCDEARGKEIIRAVNRALDEIEGLPERPSIALGLAVKTEAEQNINAMVSSADVRMYTAKHE